MSHVRKMMGAALVYTLTNALSAGIPFLMLPILTRVLTPEDYGTVAMFAVAVSVLGAVTGLSVHGAIGIRYFQREAYDFPRYVGTCLLILAASTTTVAVLVWMIVPLLEDWTKLPPTWLFAAVAVAGAQFVIQTRLVIWQCAGQPWRYGGFRVAQSALDAGVSLWLVLAAGLAWQGRTAGVALAAVTFACLACLSLRRGGWLTLRGRADYAKNALQFGVPLIPHALGGMLIASVDRFMISNMLDVASTGVYMVALQIGMVMSLLTDSINKAYAPWLIESLANHDPARDVALVRFTYLYFVALMGLSVLLGLLAPWIVNLLAGESFRGADALLIYVLLGCAFTGMYYMVANYIFFVARTGSLAILTLGTGLLNVAVSYLLLSYNGLVGAAQALMIAQALLFAGAWWLAQKFHPMPWVRALFPLRRARSTTGMR